MPHSVASLWWIFLGGARSKADNGVGEDTGGMTLKRQRCLVLICPGFWGGSVGVPSTGNRDSLTHQLN